MTAHFDLAALGMLVAVAETGGFTAASARLGRTQSAISISPWSRRIRAGRWARCSGASR